MTVINGIPHYTPKVGTLTVVYSQDTFGGELIRFFKSFAAAQAYCHFAQADGVTIQYHAEPDRAILAMVVAAHEALDNRSGNFRRERAGLPDFITHTRKTITGELVEVVRDA